MSEGPGLCRARGDLINLQLNREIPRETQGRQDWSVDASHSVHPALVFEYVSATTCVEFHR